MRPTPPSRIVYASGSIERADPARSGDIPEHWPKRERISQPREMARRSPTLEASAWRDWSAPPPDGEHADPEKDRRACGFACGNERVRSVRVPVEVDRDEAQVRVICPVARR